MNKNLVLMLVTLTLPISLFDVLGVSTSTIGDTIQVPQDYPTIQQAIDGAFPGQTIEVATGIYQERLRIEKSLTLRGKGPSMTIIDGGGALLNVVTVKANDVEINGFTMRNGSYGVYVGYSTACTLRSNCIRDNRWNLAVWGDRWQHFIHDIDSTNLVDGKPVYYWINQSNRRVPTDAGFVAVINSTNITVENLNLTTNEQGVLFLGTEKSAIRNVTTSKSDLGLYLWESHYNLITNNTIELVSYRGIFLQSSHNNTITDNTIRDGISGILLQTSNNNVIYHNNFINNRDQLDTYGSSNIWDNARGEGNYWSNYEGEDTNGDGVGDTITPHEGVDHHPLMKLWFSEIEKPFPWQTILLIVGIAATVAFAVIILLRKYLLNLSMSKTS